MRGLLALAVLVLVPSVGAQGVGTVTPSEVDTTLYFHAINIQDMPVNTQSPQYGGFTDGGWPGAGAVTLTCLHPTTGNIGGTGQGTAGMTSQAVHTYRAYSSPGFVEYDYPAADGTPRTHSERGLGYNISLNRSAPIVLHWFLGEELGAGQDGTEKVPLPNIVVRAVMRQGEAISPDDKAYDSGPVIMEGSTEPVTAFAGEVTGPGAGQVTASQVDDRWVYDFAVPLTLQQDFLHRAAGFNVRIDVAMDNPLCEDPTASTMPSTVVVIADAQHQPRIELRHDKPLQVDSAIVADAGNRTLAFAWNVTSGWGNYDVDADNATLEVFGPTQVTPVHSYTIQRIHEFAHHLEAVRQGWTVDGRGLRDGVYTAVFSVPNLQHTATAQANVTFIVHDGRVVEQEPDEAPGPGFLLVALGLLAVAALVRRFP